MSLLQEGQIIRDTYEVERYLGEGAFGEVYRVRHRFLGRQAMKVFKMINMSAVEVEQILGEAILLSRLGHPNITRVFEANTTETTKGKCGFFTMEYVAGNSLAHLWQHHTETFLPVETVVEVIRQVCSGLAVAHAEKPPIIHRDIKPGNILIGYEGGVLRARISDFGLAKRVNPLTLMASARGDLGFKAPEAFRGMGADSCASDMWSVGVSLYCLLTNEMPYPEPTGPDAMSKRRFGALRPANSLNIHVDQQLDDILSRALALNPKDRYQNGQEMLDDLNRWRPRAAGTASTPVRIIDREDKTEARAPRRASTVDSGQQGSTEESARRLAIEAVRLARQTGNVTEALKQLEAACNQLPALREQYQEDMDLWRRGIVL